jgi:DNA-binding NarL/FixJ family response regulator
MIEVSDTSPLRVLIIERQALFAKALSSLLSSDQDLVVVGESRSIDAALLAKTMPDVVVIDVDADGEALERVRSAAKASISSSPRVCALSSHVAPIAMQRCFSMGADGFVGKDVEPNDLIRAVKAIGKGGSYLDPRVGARLAAMQQRDHLSARETEVLRLLGTGLSNKEIAARLGLAEKTVKSHVSSIFSKLHIEGRTQAAVHALRLGLV